MLNNVKQLEIYFDNYYCCQTLCRTKPINESHLNSNHAQHYVFVLFFFFFIFYIRGVCTKPLFAFLGFVFANSHIYKNNTIHSIISSHSGHIHFDIHIFFFSCFSIRGF